MEIKKFIGIVLFLVSIGGWVSIFKMYQRWMEVKQFGNKGSEYEMGFGIAILIMAVFVGAIMFIGYRMAKPFSKK